MNILKSRYKALLLILFIVLGFMFTDFYNKEPTTTVFLPIYNKVIVIDPGHGGIDPGAIGSLNKKEDDINLEIALRLKRHIEDNGGIVVMTRAEDEGLYTDEPDTIRGKKNEDLRNRRILVNESESDVFLTIHLNSFPQAQYYGAQTFYKKGCEKSKKLALIIQEELKNTLDKENRRVPQPRDSIYLLREAQTTAVLIECGFLSNPREESLLNNSEYQEKVAWAIYIGIIRYFNEMGNDEL